MNFDTDAQQSKNENESAVSNAVSFDYLLNMPLYSLTKEKVEELRRKIEEKKR